MKQEIAIFWHRRDLRIDDNAGLYYALSSNYPVLPLFIFDRNILDTLEDQSDPRVAFIHQSLLHLNGAYKEYASSLRVEYGYPMEIWKTLLQQYTVKEVYANNDYEPYAIQRDAEILHLLSEHGIPFHQHKDHVIFEKDEIVKSDGSPYVVYTPYSKWWKQRISDNIPATYSVASLSKHLFVRQASKIPTLQSMGFQETAIEVPPKTIDEIQIRNYHTTRDFFSIQGTSRLSVHLRFGTISIRKVVRKALELNETFLNELIWRDFYQMILWHFPKTVDKAFKPKYEFVEWRNNEKEFQCWCDGKTGYPLIDAAMICLNKTGFMHNRLRMLTASFLTKHLLIDWRWGEHYFASKLLDYDQAANVGGWQWAAGCGTDAAPYFRIFNPDAQTKKFDSNHQFIQQWIPNYNDETYPKRIVEHSYARKRALDVYKKAVQRT